MSIQSTFLPHKHVRFNQSLLGLAGRLRQLINGPIALDEVWAVIQQESVGGRLEVSYSNVVLAINALYALGELEPLSDGRFRRAVS